MRKDLFGKTKKHVLTINVHGISLVFHCNQKRLLTDIKRYLKYFAERKIDHAATGTEKIAHCDINILNNSDYKEIRKCYVPEKSFEAFPDVWATFGTIKNYGLGYNLSAYEIKSSCLIIVNNQNDDCDCLLRRLPDQNNKILNVNFIVHLLMIEWLRSKNMFFIHASGVCREDKAFLFIGPSSSGKTTASLMGIKKGLSFMGDDLILIKDSGRKITAHSFIEDIKLCLDMTGKFCELDNLNPAKKLKNKTSEDIKSIRINVRKYFETSIADTAYVQRLYFLTEGNSLVRLKQKDTLPLIMSSSFFHSRENVSLKHFETLCRLIDTTENYSVGRGYLNRHFESLIA